MQKANVIVYRIFVNLIGLGIATAIFTHSSIDSFLTLIFSGTLLTIFNMFLRPFLVLVTLPFQIMSFGIFYIFINGFLIKITSILIDGFYLEGFWVAVGISIVNGLVNIIFDILSSNNDYRYFKWN